MKTAISVSVAAPPEVVFALARDVTRWPDLLPHYRSAKVVAREAGEAGSAAGSRVVRFVAVRPGLLRIPVVWRSRTWSEPETCRLRFIHLGGATRRMDVTWRIEATDGGCLVTIEHLFPGAPGVGAVRGPPVHAADRRADAGLVQGDRGGGRGDGRAGRPR